MFKKDSENFTKKMLEVQEQFTEFSKIREGVRPYYESFKIITIYILLGGLWILLSDKALGFFIEDKELLIKLELYKGWFYVAFTGVIFYFIICSKMKLFRGAVDKVFEGFEELSATTEELMAMDEELSQQNIELEKNRNSLVITNQRYEQAIEFLRQEKELSESIIYYAPVIIIILDTLGNIIKCNPFMKLVTGYTENELLGKNAIELLAPESNQKGMQELFNKIKQGERIGNYEFEIK